MEQLNITKGEWYDKIANCENGNYSYCEVGSTHSVFIPAKCIGESDKQAKDNAILISDAGNTYQKCELRPSELLDQRNEMLDILQELKTIPYLILYIDKIDSIIKKATE